MDGINCGIYKGVISEFSATQLKAHRASERGYLDDTGVTTERNCRLPDSTADPCACILVVGG